MLVLTRKVGESIRIGEDICLTIVEVDGKSIKIGIDAPRSVSVHREEVYSRIQEENKKAADPSANIDKIAGLIKKR